MTSKDIIRRLLSEGWYLVGGKGDHEKFKSIPCWLIMCWCRTRARM